MIELQVKRLNDKASRPSYAHEGDAGLDLYANIDTILEAETWMLVPTGIAVAVPEGHVGLIHPRSGMAADNGITVLNAPGTIDAGYRGEIKVILVNGTPKDFVIHEGDRIAQLVIQEFIPVNIIDVDDFDETARGSNGFGSSGL